MKEIERTREDHCTPAWLLELIRYIAPIALDPCSNPWSKVDAAESYSRHAGQDGLELPWGGKGLIFVNPPYSRGALLRWVIKAQEEIDKINIVGATTKTKYKPKTEIVLLAPATPDTRWFAQAWDSADAVCFLRKRVAFEGAYPAGAKQPSALFYWGPRKLQFGQVFKWHGLMVSLPVPRVSAWNECVPAVPAKRRNPGLSKGRTADFESENEGSIPSPGAAP